MRRNRVATAVLVAGGGAGLGFAIPAIALPLAEEGIESLAWSALGLEIFLAGLALGGASLLPGPLVSNLGLGPTRLPARALAALVLGTLATSYALDGVLEWSGLAERSALAEFETQLAGARGRALALVVASVVFAAGIAEELLCRGLVQRNLASRIGPASAIAVASLVFGVLHVDPIHAAFAAGLGLPLGLAAYLGGSTRASIACHVCNNLAAVLTTAFPDLAQDPTLLSSAGAAVLAGLALAFAWRTAPRTGEVEVSSPSGIAGPTPGLQPERDSDDP